MLTLIHPLNLLPYLFLVLWYVQRRRQILAKYHNELLVTTPVQDMVEQLTRLVKAMIHAPSTLRRKTTLLALWAGGVLVRRTHRDSNALMRTGFRMGLLPESRTQSSNSHPSAAAHRSAATAMIQHCCALVGKVPYYYQMSVTDQRRGRDGSREWFWAKDVQVDRCEDPLTSAHVIAMVDVDFHVDMPNFLLKHQGWPVLLYTINPTAVAGKSFETAFTFNTKNEVEWHVPGDGCYTHRLWDWNVNILRIDGWTESLIYHVERLDLGNHRCLVLLVPTSMWQFPTNYYARTLEAQALKRMTVNVGKYSRLRTIRGDGVTVSTGLAGVFTETTVTEAVDNAIAVAARTAKTELTIHAVATWISEESRKGLMVEATNLVEYHRETAKIARHVGQSVYPTASAVRGYRANFGNLDSKQAMIPFASPLIHKAFAPDNCYQNEALAVRTRVLDLKQELPPPRTKDLGYMEEFVQLMVPVAHQGHPFSDDDVVERQARPSQVALRNQASSEAHGKRKASMMLKRETYSKMNDPRGITQINTHDKTEYSKYTYSMQDHVVKHCSWYAFNRTPAEIAARVADLCLKATWYVILTDFSRMDGRVSECMRHLERMFALRYFAVEHHARIVELLETQHHLQGCTTHGVRYSSEWARLSGSPETALFNTVINAFIAYAALRDTGLSPTEAWEKLGIYGGDDGLSADVDVPKYESAAQRFGQVLDVTQVRRGENGVDFLARWYGPGVWWGDMNSCTDIPRAMAKFHVTVCLPAALSPEDKFYEKTLSLAFTDANTPGLGLLVRRARKEKPDFETSCKRLLLSYNAVEKPDERYPNEEADWMMDRLRREAPGINLDPLVEWSEGKGGLLELPLVLEPEPAQRAKTSMIESGELVPAAGQSYDDAVREGARRQSIAPQNAAQEIMPTPAPVETSTSALASAPPLDTGTLPFAKSAAVPNELQEALSGAIPPLDLSNVSPRPAAAKPVARKKILVRPSNPAPSAPNKPKPKQRPHLQGAQPGGPNPKAPKPPSAKGKQKQPPAGRV